MDGNNAYAEEVGAIHGVEEHHGHHGQVGTVHDAGDEDLFQLPAIRMW
jgi:hypothetical protein